MVAQPFYYNVIGELVIIGVAHSNHTYCFKGNTLVLLTLQKQKLTLKKRGMFYSVYFNEVKVFLFDFPLTHNDKLYSSLVNIVV